jgi:uncharacterized protein (TIGR01370 family)
LAYPVADSLRSGEQNKLMGRHGKPAKPKAEAKRCLRPKRSGRGFFATIIVSAILALSLTAVPLAQAYQLRAPSNPVLNSADRDLRSIRSWHYIMAAADLDVFARRDWPIQAIDSAQYPFEMIVTSLRAGPQADREHWTDAFLLGDNIRAWQNSTPEGKVFLAYIGLSGLSTHHYLNGVPMSARANWVDAKGQPTASAPWWLLCPVGEYPGLNKVAFWAQEWKQHLLTQVEHAIIIGANGVFLDEFDGTAYRLTVIDPTCARGLAVGLDLEREMIRLLEEIRAYVESKQLGRRFLIVVSDGRATLKKYRDFLPLIDGSLAEHTFFAGWDLPDFLNGPEQDFRTKESIAFITELTAAGLPVFSLDYVTDPAKIGRLAALASTLRFLPAVSEHKILTISKPLNVIWCDKTQCQNNGGFLASRQLAVPIGDAFFDILEARFPDSFRPRWRLTRLHADGDGTWIYRHYRETGKYVGYRQSDHAAAYFDATTGTFLTQGTIESWVKELSAP